MSVAKYRLVLLGAGQVGSHLAHRIDECPELELVQIYSRKFASVQALAETLSREPSSTDSLGEVVYDADYYVFALSDSALTTVWAQMPKTRGIWLHTAGSVPLSAMQPYHGSSGVLYPLQTFSRSRCLDWTKIPIYTEATSPELLGNVMSLASMLSPNVHHASSEERQLIHLSAVFVCNFANHLWALGEELMMQQGLDPKTLQPLIEETCAKMLAMSPREAQTGPARRGDRMTIERHLDLLREVRADLIPLYTELSDSIQRMYNI